MPDYQKMYHSLFNDVTDAVSRLQQAQQRTEELYMNSPETILTPIPGGDDKNEIGTPEKLPSRKKKPRFRDER
jgi:hypothetical protein